MNPWDEQSAPRHPLYVLSDDAPRLVLQLGEVAVGPELQVSSRPDGRFVSVDDALDNDHAVRDAFLHLSPDPALERWRRVRAIGLAAPVAWSMFVLKDLEEVNRLAKDAKQVVSSEEFRELERDPRTSAAARAKHEKIDRAVAMKWGYATIEAAIGLAAFVVILAGLRRLRAIPIAVGLGAGMFWLFHAGMPDRCFRAFRELPLAALGLVGAIATLLLAPSETKVTAALRARLGLRGEVTAAPARQDLFATLAAAWAGIALPFLLRFLANVRASDLLRTSFFVGFCFLTFFGFLFWRREESRLAPNLARLALVAALGFGVTAAADIASRAAFGSYVEAKHCINPATAGAAKKAQEQSAKETTAARRETQTRTLAFFIAVFAAPVAEEVLYRGTLQRLARRRLGARWSMLLSATIFMFAHALAFPTAFYQHFALGLAFAAVFELAGAGAVGVVASAATHAMWNGWLAAMPVFG